jgi:PhnB protein
MKFSDGPPEACPEGAADRIMHGCLLVDGRALMASDTVPKYPHQGNKGFAVSLGYPSAAEARKAFDALAEGGTVTMPIEKTFWAEAFGMLTDRFGIPWMIGGGQQS